MVSDCGEGNVVLKHQDIFGEKGVVRTISFSCHPCGGEPGYGSACHILLFE